MKGLRLRGDDADGMALADLARAAPAAMQARYRVLRPAHDDDDDLHEHEDAFILFSEIIDSAVEVALREAGHDVVDGRTMDLRRATVVDGLLAAVPLRPETLRAVAGDVVFVAESAAAAARLCEQLLLLGRDDALVGRVGTTTSLVRLTSPPWWLVSRVMDGCEAETQVFVSSLPTAPPAAASSSLYVAAGWRHPLAAVFASALQRQQQVGLLHQDGTLQRLAVPLAEAPILDAIRPEVPPASVATVTAAVASFPVQLRLTAAADDTEEPELFVVDDGALPRLQAFVEGAAPDELDRIVLGRLADDTGRARTVVRELVRPGVARLGARLQSLLQSPGYVRLVGVEGLYLPAGRRLVPALRERTLRELVGLAPDDEGRAAAGVIVDEDGDGLKLTALAALEAAPLSQLTSWILTGRRTIYDRLFEDAVLTFPGVQLERAPRVVPERAPRVRGTPPVSMPVPRRPVVVSTSPTTAAATTSPDVAAWQETERALQAQVLTALEDAGLWGSLAEAKAALKRDDVVETASTALFLGAPLPMATVTAMAPEGLALLDLVTLDQPSHLQAVRLCVEVLRLLKRRDDDGLRDALLQQATRALGKDTLAVPRRLQWAVMLAIARHLHDPIGLTRAREAVLGALNTKGLSEVLDLPRFVRTSLAMSGLGDAGSAGRSQVKTEQAAMLERSLRTLVPDPEGVSDGRGALLKVIFAHGLARVGGGARPILAALEGELPAHDAPVQTLLKLYSARVVFVLTRGDVASDDAWRGEVKQVLAAVDRPEDRRVAEWLIKRSAWLKHETTADTTTGLRPSLTRVVDTAWQAFEAGARVDVVAAIRDARQVPGTYDFEVVAALDRLLTLALRTGRDDVIAGSAQAAREAASSVRILAHRARLLGSTLRAAATIGDAGIVEASLDDVAGIASDRNVPSVRDLLAAIRPALLALRRVGASDAARRLLQAFVPLTTTFGRETGPLSAAVAQGYLQLGDAEAAAAMLDRALERVWLPNTQHIDRFEAATAVVTALAHWPTDERYRLMERFVDQLGMFTDTFTTGRYFPTHQILLAERIVDSLVDDSTVRTDALQGWLDEDEARVRRRVLADWRAFVA